MKKLIYLIIAIFIFSCSDDEASKEPGSIEVTISYYYNNFIGYRYDVGAKVFVYDSDLSNQIHRDSMNVVFARLGILVDKDGEIIGGDFETPSLYEAEANADGVAFISDVKPGDYFIMVASEGRWTYSVKEIEVLPGENLILTKNFGYLNEFLPRGESW
ncbi:carboxypeptidase-like regulatory domain-containing protein [uncultured Draconibacterium sp.]|uniref:carboxypeptidase-like regulatory domain-containing protein n=1 Tax=uncultured Draconibacterium sp. TaxID=1573823 RepID=UPI0029C96420|nr:carboxypeptidase-like regulatory domain-containing protein [uncultured Draconibacterium sp.]